jgi:hypothetical protein
MEREHKKAKGKEEGKSGGAHHLDEAIIRTHRQVDVKGGIRRNALEHRLDVLHDLLVIKRPYHEHGPLKGCIRHHLIQSACPPHQR